MTGFNSVIIVCVCVAATMKLYQINSMEIGYIVDNS